MAVERLCDMRARTRTGNEASDRLRKFLILHVWLCKWLLFKIQFLAYISQFYVQSPSFVSPCSLPLTDVCFYIFNNILEFFVFILNSSPQTQDKDSFFVFLRSMTEEIFEISLRENIRKHVYGAHVNRSPRRTMFTYNFQTYTISRRESFFSPGSGPRLGHKISTKYAAFPSKWSDCKGRGNFIVGESLSSPHLPRTHKKGTRKLESVSSAMWVMNIAKTVSSVVWNMVSRFQVVAVCTVSEAESKRFQRNETGRAFLQFNWP